MVDAASETPAPPRRPGRRRLRLLLLLLIVAAGAAAFLQVDRAERWLRQRLLREAAERGFAASLRDLQVGLLPPQVDLYGLELRWGRAADAPVFLQVERIEAVPSLRRLLGGRLAFRHVAVHRPLLTEPPGPLHAGAPPPAAGAEGDGSFGVAVDRLSVYDGSLRFGGSSRALAGELRGLELDGSLPADRGSIPWRLLARAVRLEGPASWRWEGRAEARGALVGRRLDVQRLRARNDSWEVDLHGSTELSADPQWRLEGRARAPAEELRRLLPGVPEISGRLQLSGAARGRGGQVEAEAALSSARVSVAAVPVENLSGRVRLGAGSFALDGVEAAALGGRLRADYEARRDAGGGWLHRLRVEPADVDLAEALAALGQGKLPWNARATGRAEVRWSGADLASLRGDGSLALRPGAVRPRRRYPLGGEVELAVRGRRLQVRSASLRGEGGKLDAQAHLGIEEGEVAFRARVDRPETVRAGYVEPILARVSPGASLPELGPLSGRLQMEGRAFTGAAGPLAMAVVEGSDVGWEGLAVGRVSGLLWLDGPLLHVSEALAEGAGHRFEGSLDLWVGGPASGRLQASARFEAQDLDPWARAVSGRSVPVAGAAAGELRIARHGCGMEGQVSLEMPRAELFGQVAADLHAEVHLVPGRMRLEDVRADLAGGRLQAAGEILLQEEPSLALTVAAEALRPDTLLPPAAARHLGGTVAVDGRLEGSVADPEIQATLRYRGVEGSPIDLGDAEAQIEGRLDGLRVRMSAPAHGLTAFGQIEGTPDLPVRLNLLGEDLDLALLKPLLGWEETVDLRGVVDLNAAVFGPLARPEQVRAEARVTRLIARLPGYELRNRGPLSMGWSEGVAVLRPSQLVGEGTDLTLRGRLAPGGEVESSLSGTVDLTLLGALDPGLQVGGQARLDLRVESGQEGPAYSGEIAFHDATLQHRSFPAVATELEGEARFRGPELTLSRLSGRLGRGEVTGTGALRFDGVRPVGVRLELLGRDVRLQYPAELESVGDFRLVLKDTPEGLSLTGRADIVRGIYRLPAMARASVLPARARPAVGAGGQVGEGSGFGERVALDIRIHAPHSLYIRDQDVNVEAYGELQLGGTLSTPQLSGRIIALEGGIIHFRNVRYRVTTGFVDFAEYGEIDPFFHVEAVTTVRDYEVTLEADGNLSDFTFELSSYPPLTHEEILVLLLTGRTPDERASMGGALLGGEMAEALSAPLGSGFARALGLTQVRIEPIDVNGNARLTLVKDVRQDLRVSFSDDFGAAQAQVYQIEYDVTPKLEFIASRDEDGGVGGDLRYTTRRYSYRRRQPEVEGGPRLGSVVLVDPLPVKREHLESRLGLKEGRPFRRARIVDAVDRLREYLSRRGYHEARVRVEEKEAGERVDLRFHVNGGARYVLLLDGAVKEEKLRKRLLESLATFPGDVENMVRREIVEFHRARGFAEPQVRLQVEEDRPEQRTLRFRIEPGVRARTARIELRGVAAFGEERILQVMLTRPGKLLRRDVLDEDLRTIARFYREQGYQDVRIDEPQIVLDGDPPQATIGLSIREGPAWRIGAIRFEGNTIFSGDQLAERLDLTVGDPVTRNSLDAARTALRLRYDGVGYDEARVTYAVEGEEPSARVVVFRFEEGPHHVVGDIDVVGNEHTRGKVIWRDLGINRGENLSREKLLQAQRRLSRLGIFRTVEVRVEGEPTEEVRPVVVDVREAPNVRFSFGGGFDTEVGASGFFQVRNNNLWGRNQTLGAVVSASAINQRVRFSFLEPRLFGRPIEGLLTTAWSDEEKESFDEERLQLSLGGTKSLGPYRYIGDYRLEDVDLSNVQITGVDELADEKVSDVRLGSVGATVIRNLRDDVFNPREGLFYSMELRLFAQQLASEEDFARFFGHISYHLPVTARSTWAQGLRIGLADAFGDSVVPISERFFAGGDSSLRGFERDEVGPRDPVTGSPTGGEALFLFNEGFRFPIAGALSGTVFLDVGNVYGTIGDLGTGGVRWVAGGGLHFRTPIGPLRLEYGRKLDREAGESRGELFFSIGQPF